MTGLALAMSVAAPARADVHADAEQAFRDGRTALAAGELQRACSKFAESQRLEPAAGTLLNLAECFEKRGLAASARTTYLEAAKAAAAHGRADWQKLASSRAAALEKDVSVVMIVVSPEAKVSGLEVTCDNAKGEINQPITVDPGSHDIRASAPGRKPWSTQVSTDRAGVQRVTVPVLEAETELPPPPPPPPPRQLAAEDEGETQRLIGIVVGGMGIGGLAFGALTGLVAKGKKDDAERLCKGYPAHCPSDGSGTRANDGAKTFALLSTIGFAAGGALIATGAVLYITSGAPSGVAPAQRTARQRRVFAIGPQAGSGLVGLSIAGGF